MRQINYSIPLIHCSDQSVIQSIQCIHLVCNNTVTRVHIAAFLDHATLGPKMNTLNWCSVFISGGSVEALEGKILFLVKGLFLLLVVLLYQRVSNHLRATLKELPPDPFQDASFNSQCSIPGGHSHLQGFTKHAMKSKYSPGSGHSFAIHCLVRLMTPCPSSTLHSDQSLQGPYSCPLTARCPS